MTDKTCATCIWYDRYFEQAYGFCRDRQEWVSAQGTCEVHSDGRKTEAVSVLREQFTDNPNFPRKRRMA